MATRGAATAAPERLYTIQEAADLWSVSRDFIEGLLRRRELSFVLVGQRRRIPASALANYSADHLEGAR